jgi:archaellum component FlaC
VEGWVQIAVGIACWAIVVLFVVQVGVWIALYRLLKGVVATVNDLKARFDPQINQIQLTVGDLQRTIAHVTETTNQLSSEVRAVSTAVTTSAERITVVATESAEEVRGLVIATSAEIKALVTVTSGQIRDLVATSSDEIHTVVRASSHTAHGGLERVDLAVERTVTRFEETGEYVQTQVLTPVREVAAIVKGIKAALETLFGYPDRKPIDQAYQDEELFI